MSLSKGQERLLDAVMLGGLLVAGSYIARRATDEVWRVVSDDPPPDPDDPDTNLRDALIWSLASAVLVGLTRLLLRRQFAKVRRRPLMERVKRRLT